MCNRQVPMIKKLLGLYQVNMLVCPRNVAVSLICVEESKK